MGSSLAIHQTFSYFTICQLHSNYPHKRDEGTHAKMWNQHSQQPINRDNRVSFTGQGINEAENPQDGILFSHKKERNPHTTEGRTLKVFPKGKGQTQKAGTVCACLRKSCRMGKPTEIESRRWCPGLGGNCQPWGGERPFWSWILVTAAPLWRQ